MRVERVSCRRLEDDYVYEQCLKDQANRVGPAVPKVHHEKLLKLLFMVKLTSRVNGQQCNVSSGNAEQTWSPWWWIS